MLSKNNLKNLIINFKDKLFYIIFFILLLALSRIIPHPPNFTPIIAAAVMGPVLIKPKFIPLF